VCVRAKTARAGDPPLVQPSISPSRRARAPTVRIGTANSRVRRRPSVCRCMAWPPSARVEQSGHAWYRRRSSTCARPLRVCQRPVQQPGVSGSPSHAVVVSATGIMPLALSCSPVCARTEPPSTAHPCPRSCSPTCPCSRHRCRCWSSQRPQARARGQLGHQRLTAWSVSSSILVCCCGFLSALQSAPCGAR
jgi:hypothetical protein